MPCFRLALLPAALAALFSQLAAAQQDVQLRSSGTLSVPTSVRGGPVYFEADRLHGVEGQFLEAEGNVLMRNLEGQVEGQWLRYTPADDTLEARGRVVFTRQGYRIEGETLTLKLTPRIGAMQQVRYQFDREAIAETRSQRWALGAPVAEVPGRKSQGRGAATTLHFEGEGLYQLDQATYTTCPVDDPDWQLRTSQLDLDYNTNLGVAWNSRIEFKGVPILYAPWFDFALDNRRKSGFLAPSAGVSDERGFELMLPWYWNIAPNRDATLVPRPMTRRGLQMGGEFRYLEPAYHGDLTAEVLPNDRVADRDRYRLMFRHQQRFSPRLTGSLSLEGVSDDAYFTELSSLVNETSRVNLPREASLAYAGEGWEAVARIQTYQTLQDPLNTIEAPYHKRPQIQLRADRRQLGNTPLLLDLGSELVRFEHELGSKAAGDRLNLYPSLRLPFESAYGFITPRLGIDYTRYHLTRNPDVDPLTAGAQPGPGELTRTLPIFSLDSGLFFERNWLFQGVDYVQTLEPRLFYVQIPYRDQDAFPVFDTSLPDLSLAQLFNENQYVGIDRINDAKQLTLAVTSRLIEDRRGFERLQFTLGQRYYFTEQQVVLPGTTARGNNFSDVLALVSGQLSERWRFSSGLQYNAADDVTARANLGLQYTRGPGRVVNGNFRYINDRYTSTGAEGINQVDLSWQWPVKRQWYSLGRINYSVKDRGLVEGLLGFEYNAGCWSLRGVVQQLATSTTETSNAFYIQLELRGLTRLGFDPLDVLRRNISGYTKSDEIE